MMSDRVRLTHRAGENGEHGGSEASHRRRTAWYYVRIFLVGAIIYPLGELCWRGQTHWSMAILGGACLCAIAFVSERTSGILDLFGRALICCVIISEAEFIFGVILNLIAGLEIWDYSEKPFNLLGQICAEYSLLWLSLSLPTIAIFDACRTRIGNRGEGGFNEKQR